MVVHGIPEAGDYECGVSHYKGPLIKTKRQTTKDETAKLLPILARFGNVTSPLVAQLQSLLIDDSVWIHKCWDQWDKIKRIKSQFDDSLYTLSLEDACDACYYCHTSDSYMCE